MKTNLTIKLLLLIMIISPSCKSDNSKKNNKDNTKIEQKDMSLIERVLNAQVARGADERGMENKLPETTEQEDFEASIRIIDSILLKNGYQKQSQIDFMQRVQNIFGEFLVTKFENQNIIDFDITDSNPKCNSRESESESKYFYQTGSELSGFHIEKNMQIISNFYYIPELIDYQKLYPESAKLEDKKFRYYDEQEGETYPLLRWKDITDLPQQRDQNINILIHRNKYLFNDSKASLTWLKLNDTDFLESLVKIFGYVDDKDLLQWVIKRTLSNKNNKGEDYNSLFFMKDCSNQFVFHKATFNLLKEKIDNPSIEALKSYLDNRKENEDLQNLSFEQKAQVLAQVLYIGEYFAQQEEYSGQFAFKFMGPFYEYDDQRDKYDEEFKKNNYYNLPDFEKLWETAKEEGDGIGLPM